MARLPLLLAVPLLALLLFFSGSLFPPVAPPAAVERPGAPERTAAVKVPVVVEKVEVKVPTADWSLHIERWCVAPLFPCYLLTSTHVKPHFTNLQFQFDLFY